jgi:hypothetical protein
VSGREVTLFAIESQAELDEVPAVAPAATLNTGTDDARKLASTPYLWPVSLKPLAMLGWIRRDAARTLARHALPPEREPSLFTRRLIDATMASVCAVGGCPFTTV